MCVRDTKRANVRIEKRKRQEDEEKQRRENKNISNYFNATTRVAPPKQKVSTILLIRENELADITSLLGSCYG